MCRVPKPVSLGSEVICHEDHPMRYLVLLKMWNQQYRKSSNPSFHFSFDLKLGAEPGN